MNPAVSTEPMWGPDVHFGQRRKASFMRIVTLLVAIALTACAHGKPLQLYVTVL